MNYVSTALRYGYNLLSTTISAPIEIDHYWLRNRVTQQMVLEDEPRRTDFRSFRLFVEFRRFGKGPYITYFDNLQEHSDWITGSKRSSLLLGPELMPTVALLRVGDAFELDIYPQVLKYISTRGNDLDIMPCIMDIVEQNRPTSFCAACLSVTSPPQLFVKNALGEEALLLGPAYNLSTAEYQ
jgi:hypothetical protein